MSVPGLDPTHTWYRVADRGVPAEGRRIHVRVAERFVTVFRNKGKLSCLDSVCYHASGPMTEGKVEDIEDLGVSVVLCPWHRFAVTLDGGMRAYQSVAFMNGKPVNAGWTLGKVVQRPHLVAEVASGLYVVSSSSRSMLPLPFPCSLSQVSFSHEQRILPPSSTIPSPSSDVAATFLLQHVLFFD